MNCRYCGYLKPQHGVDCPIVALDGDGDMKLWKEGLADGHAGFPKASQHSAYKLGYRRAQASQEAATNGHSWSTT
jgi:hypothetical protein